MRTDSNFYSKGEERDAAIKECVDMIKFYRSPLPPKYRKQFRDRLSYYTSLKKKLMSDVRLDKMRERNKL